MKTKIAINGFGRIGRMSFRVMSQREDMEVVAINDLTDTKTLAHLLKYDTNYGVFEHEVGFDESSIIVDGIHIPIYAEKDPASLPWGQLEVDIVIESTGRFLTTEAAGAHLQAGAKKVVISAPAKDEETATVVIGANAENMDHSGDIISNASCTTNSIAAIMDIMVREFGVEKAMLTTIHSYTASQNLQDGPGKDLREARAAAQNIVPTTTGAAKAVALTVPSLVNKFDWLSVRVPTSVVSLSDVTMILKKDTTKEELNKVLSEQIADPFYSGILAVSSEPLVSSDYVGNSLSGTVDLLLTNVVDGNLAKIVVWYDNEWGYSNRLIEMVERVARQMHATNKENI